MRFSATDQLDKRGFTEVCCIGCNEILNNGSTGYTWIYRGVLYRM